MKFVVVVVFGYVLLCGIFVNNLKGINVKNDLYYNYNNKNSLSPYDIVNVSSTFKYDDNIQITLNANSPLEYMKTKKDLISLYFDNKHNDFTQQQQHNELLSSTQIHTHNTNTNEELIPIQQIESDSNYKEIKNGIINTFTGDNILHNNNSNNNNNGKFWCSSGNHNFNTTINILITLSKPFRISSLSINWAFAPGQYQILTSNTSLSSLTVLSPWENTIANGTFSFWQSALSSQSTRWKYKSFITTKSFHPNIFAKYIQINMRYPFNNYYGIYSLHIYTPIISHIMLKSKLLNHNNLCVSSLNTKVTDSSPLIAMNCLQAISYSDNRSIFKLHSKGMITTVNGDKCIQSLHLSDNIELTDCAKANVFGDDREKWTVDYEGKIVSIKHDNVCIGIDLNDNNDILPLHTLDIKVNSEQNDNKHKAIHAFTLGDNEYWASDVSDSEVIFEIYLSKYSSVLSTVNIDWKFPAKYYEVYALYNDGNWEMVYSINDNKDTVTDINLNDKEYSGIKIVMIESTVKINMKNVYAINNIRLITNTKRMKKMNCDDVIEQNNVFDIIEINNNINTNTKMKFDITESKLLNTKHKLNSIQRSFMEIPGMLITMKEKAIQYKTLLQTFDNKIYDYQKQLELLIDDINNNNNYNINSNTQTNIQLGSDSSNPAYNCASILHNNPHKRSGFYWIKSECMLHSLKIYCDFDIYQHKGIVDIVIYNNNNNKVPFHIKTYNDIRNICYSIGLEPIEITNLQILETIHTLIHILGFDISNNNNIIPFAYDYTCSNNVKCTNHQYNSLNSDLSPDITSIINEYISIQNTNNILINTLYNDNHHIHHYSHNIAAFGKVDNVVYETLSNKLNIIGVICSSNQHEIVNKRKDYIELSCEDSLRKEDIMKDYYKKYTSLKMVCPRNCMNYEKGYVYGSDIYSDNSSVCRAGIHSGVISNEGGFIEVNMVSGVEKYFGSERNGVKSLDWDIKGDKAFKVKKYKGVCPIDSVEGNVNRKDTENEIENDDESDDDMVSFIEVDERVEILKQIEMFLNKTNNNNDTSKSDVNQYSSNHNNISHVTSHDTSHPLAYFQNKFKKQSFHLSTISSYSTFLQSIIGETSTHIDYLSKHPYLGIEPQLTLFTTLKQKYYSLQTVLTLLNTKLQTANHYLSHELTQTTTKHHQLHFQSTFNETYLDKDITCNYNIFTSINGKGETPKWFYYNNNIKQTGNFIDNRTGSHLIIKHRYYKDFQLETNVIIHDDSNTFGICYRYINEYNYYIFELSATNGGYTRIRRFVDGNGIELAKINNSGFIMDIWYDIKIRCIVNICEIYLRERNDKYELIFKNEDTYFKKGKIAFASQGIKNLLINNISITPIQCKDIYHTYTFNNNQSSCIEYTETFDNEFMERWYVNDPKSKWIITRNSFGTNVSLYQSSSFTNSNNTLYQEGSLIIMKNKHYTCNKGNIHITFKAFDVNGIVGIVFRYHKGNYYILEISDMNKHFIRIRKYINHKYTLLGINNQYYYNINTWISITLTFNKNTFNAFIITHNNDDQRVKVFKENIIDNDLAYGVIGLSAFNTRVVVNNIQILPHVETNNTNTYEQDRKNIKINNYSWKQCLDNNKRSKLCTVLFISQIDIDNCVNNFCKSCCDKTVDTTNPVHRHLCNKQCTKSTFHLSLSPSKHKQSWLSCIESTSLPYKQQQQPLYSSCETFPTNNSKHKCKVNMCYTCCNNNLTLSDDDIKECYSKCNKAFNISK